MGLYWVNYRLKLDYYKGIDLQFGCFCPSLNINGNIILGKMTPYKTPNQNLTYSINCLIYWFYCDSSQSLENCIRIGKWCTNY